MRLNPFAVSRGGLPIESVWLKDSVDTGIEYGGMSYPLWLAAVRCGATLDELAKLDDGGYRLRFQAKLIAFDRVRRLEEMHSQDAVSRAVERKAKKHRR